MREPVPILMRAYLFTRLSAKIFVFATVFRVGILRESRATLIILARIHTCVLF